MQIKILGTGCRNCVALTENTKKALQETGINAEVVKVEELKDIMAYGIMSTPGLVIDEKVVSYGKVLKPNEIVQILNKTVEK
ncbi:MAG: thioredoxin family protein [Syntrophomonas sp.]|nr:thioredoxin family protein [Syntrophomonas sp.]